MRKIKDISEPPTNDGCYDELEGEDLSEVFPACTITIQCDEGKDPKIVIERVSELIRQGFTSGYYPIWNISEKQ